MEDDMRMFSLSAEQIKYKDILNKEFLELEVWAISDVNPNRNNTHFTLDSMKKALDKGLANKPIVGFFDKGDFVEHNGKVEYDAELQEGYWNVSTQYGERILGWIRESDPIEIVEKDGLHWIKFNCAICTTYCYQQVKKLLKDRSKKVSVEITVLQSEEREDGIEEIQEFSLNGVTILGSKNGKAVIEAIPGAHASILEQLDSNVLEGQKKVLSFAYKNIEKNANVDNIKTEKEAYSNMDQVKEEESMSVVGCASDNQENKEENVENNACGCDEKECNNSCDENVEMKCESGECKGEDTDYKEDEHKDEEHPDDEHGEDKGDNKEEPKDVEKESCDDKEDLSAKCEALSKQCDEYKCENEQLKAKLEEKENECNGYKAECEKYQDYSEIKTRMETAENKVHEYFCMELENKAIAMMSGVSIPEEDMKSIKDKCHNGTYATEEDIKRDIAYIAFSAQTASGVKFSSPIFNNIEGENTNNYKTMTREQRIAARCKSSK